MMPLRDPYGAEAHNSLSARSHSHWVQYYSCMHFDDSVTIMARIRLARIALTKLQKAIFGTRRVALESKKITYESLVLSLLLYCSECWVVSAENMRLLQRFHRKSIRIMCRVTRHHTRTHPTFWGGKHICRLRTPLTANDPD
jgi:hypothetical protein